jgi:OOP family OmpA-OmpF porin
MRWRASLIALALGGAAAAQDFPPALPAGAIETHARDAAPATWPTPWRSWSADAPPVETLEGALALRVFRLDGPETTALGVARAMQATLSAAGFETVLDCAADGCGGFDFRNAIPAAPTMRLAARDFRQLTMRRGGDVAALTLSRAGDALWGQLATLQSARRPAPAPPPAEPPEAASADAAPAEGPPNDAAPPGSSPPPAAAQPTDSAGAALAFDAAGRAVLEGVAFRPGSTELSEDSADSLAAAATAINAMPDRRFVLVGHTDDAGDLAVNVRVGKARAEAVRQALIAAGIAADRLTAEGAGWLAPRADNATEAGRASNRRVELLAR